MSKVPFWRKTHIQTLGRWIKTVLEGAGIDMSLFKSHSTRHASATAAFAADIPIDEILKRAGWSNAMTFKRFYCKSVIDQIIPSYIITIVSVDSVKV